MIKDIITGKVSHGSFKLPLEFRMVGVNQSMTAIFDTGCSHSCISANLLELPNGITKDELKYVLMYRYDVKLSIGAGIESKSDSDNTERAELRESINKINSIKKDVSKNKELTVKERNKIVKSLLTTEYKHLVDKVINYRGLRFECKAHDYTIDNVNVGNYNIKIAFNIDNIALIGMHIIKDLYTKIYSKNNQIYLFATKNSESASKDIDKYIEDHSDLLEYGIEITEEMVLANYVYNNLM